MSDTLEPTRWRKLKYTPLRDLLRGRVTGRLDLAGRIARSDLPEPVQQLIRRVVRRTHLWSLEKTDVADELIAHFQDGLEAGVSADELVDSFGDEKQAAKLIRRAKRRNRPLAWHVLNGSIKALAILLFLYVGIGVSYFASRPTPTVDYLAILNADARSIPEADRAWPLYREAILARGDEGTPSDWDATWPGDASWSEVQAYVASQREAIAFIKAAATKPALGRPVGTGVPEKDRVLWPNSEPMEERQVQPLPYTLPPLGELRRLARLLALDVLVAADGGDASRTLEGLQALLAMSEHAREGGTLISHLVGMSIRVMVHDRAAWILQHRPALLSDKALRDLAHRLAQSETANDLIDFGVERMTALDMIQWTYSNGGIGGGHITPEGLALIEELTRDPAYSDLGINPGLSERALDVAFKPGWMLRVARRDETVAKAEEIFRLAAMELNTPIWEIDDGGVEDLVDHLETPRYFLLRRVLPAPFAARRTAEKSLALQDGIVAAIALEVHRRATGAYPEDLAALTPGLLPKVPPDRITGEPLRYRLIDGRPVIYSVGADRDDDGGRPPQNQAGEPAPMRAASWETDPDPDREGDWVVYPTHLRHR